MLFCSKALLALSYLLYRLRRAFAPGVFLAVNADKGTAARRTILLEQKFIFFLAILLINASSGLSTICSIMIYSIVRCVDGAVRPCSQLFARVMRMNPDGIKRAYFEVNGLQG